LWANLLNFLCKDLLYQKISLNIWVTYVCALFCLSQIFTRVKIFAVSAWKYCCRARDDRNFAHPRKNIVTDKKIISSSSGKVCQQFRNILFLESSNIRLAANKFRLTNFKLQPITSNSLHAKLGALHMPKLLLQRACSNTGSIRDDPYWTSIGRTVHNYRAIQYK
jgi:hypothetical protein